MSNEKGRAPLSLHLARSMAREIETLHIKARAEVLYSFGTGGYTVVAHSPMAGQDSVAILSLDAYETFTRLRGDAWRRLRRERGQETTHTEMKRTDLMQMSRLRAYMADEDEDKDKDEEAGE